MIFFSVVIQNFHVSVFFTVFFLFRTFFIDYVGQRRIDNL